MKNIVIHNLRFDSTNMPFDLMLSLFIFLFSVTLAPSSLSPFFRQSDQRGFLEGTPVRLYEHCEHWIKMKRYFFSGTQTIVGVTRRLIRALSVNFSSNQLWQVVEASIKP